MNILTKKILSLNISLELKYALIQLHCTNLNKLLKNYYISDLINAGWDNSLLNELYLFLSQYHLENELKKINPKEILTTPFVQLNWSKSLDMIQTEKGINERWQVTAILSQFLEILQKLPCYNLYGLLKAFTIKELKNRGFNDEVVLLLKTFLQLHQLENELKPV